MSSPSNPATGPAELARQAGRFTVADIIRRSARVYAELPAIACGETTISYRELDERSDRLAGALAGLGLGHGDRLSVLSTTRPEYVEYVQFLDYDEVPRSVTGKILRYELERLESVTEEQRI